MTILIKFPSNTFSSTNTLNHDFEYYHNMAEKGATNYKEDDDSFGFIGIIIFFAFIFFTFWGLSKVLSSSDFNFGKTRK